MPGALDAEFRRLKSITERFNFSRIGRSKVMAARIDDIVQFAFLRKSKYDNSFQLVSGVWCEEFAIGVKSFSEELSASPISPDISELGIGVNHWWRTKCEGDLENLDRTIELVAIPMMGALSSLHAVNCALGELHQEQLSSFSTLRDSGFLGQSLIEMPAAAELATQEDLKKFAMKVTACSSFVSEFDLRQSERQVVLIKQRGDLVNVIEFRLSSFGLFMSIHYYVFHTGVWKVRRELKGLYAQFNGDAVKIDGIRTVSVDAAAGRANEISTLLEKQAADFFESVSSTKDFISQCGSSLPATIASRLA